VDHEPNQPLPSDEATEAQTVVHWTCLTFQNGLAAQLGKTPMSTPLGTFAIPAISGQSLVFRVYHISVISVYGGK